MGEVEGADMEILRDLCQGDGLIIGGIEAPAHGVHEIVFLRWQYGMAARDVQGQKQQRAEQMIDAFFWMAALPLCAAVDEFTQMAEGGKELLCLLDGQHSFWQELPFWKIGKMQVLDRTGVDAEIAVCRGRLVVHDTLPYEQQVALLRVVALPVDDMDAVAFGDQDELCHIFMAVHGAGHRGIRCFRMVECHELRHGFAGEDRLVFCCDKCHGTASILEYRLIYRTV